MSRLTIWIVVLLLLVPLASAHAIDQGPVTKNVENYQIQFSTEPKFPVTGKATHMDFIIKDANENLLSDLNVTLELHKQETITSDLNEEKKGHYGTEHSFSEAGSYELHIIINGDELETGFNLNIDTFGLSGILRTGIIVMFILTLLALMYRECRKKK